MKHLIQTEHVTVTLTGYWVKVIQDERVKIYKLQLGTKFWLYTTEKMQQLWFVGFIRNTRTISLRQLHTTQPI